MKCKQCGSSLDNQANKCPSCGNSINNESSTTKKCGSCGNVFKILSGLILAGLAAFFLWTQFTNTLPDAASGQLKALKEGRLKEAYDSYASKSFKSSTSLDQFKQFINGFPVLLKNRSVRLVDRKLEGDREIVHLMITNDQGVETPVSFQMVNENGHWLVENIKIGS